MKKFFSVLLLLVLCTSLSFAQGYKKGVHNLNVGIGFGLAGVYGDADFPPISVGFQYGFHEKFSLGGIIGYTQSSYNYGGWWFNGNQDWEWTYTYIIVGARGEYHFVDVTDDFDLYAGATVGYNIVSVTEPDGWGGVGYTAEGSYALFGFHGGIRYPLSPSIGLFAEVGYGIGYITAGVNFKL